MIYFWFLVILCRPDISIQPANDHRGKEATATHIRALIDFSLPANLSHNDVEKSLLTVNSYRVGNQSPHEAVVRKEAGLAFGMSLPSDETQNVTKNESSKSSTSALVQQAPCA